jgi:hypothetical protein
MNVTSPHQLDLYSAAVWTWSLTIIPHLVTASSILVVGYLFFTWASRGWS